MAIKGLVRKAVTLFLAVGAMTFGLIALASTPSGAATTPDTAVFAEAPSATPNYIFPFMSLAFFSVYNIDQFQQLMYRPLYWFGNGSTPDLNPSLSLADSPVYSDGDSVVTINLKDYKWSNGEDVTAGDVMFWMNMMHADKANWAAYAPGTIPDNIKSIKIDSPTSLTFTLNRAYNAYWYTYNQLSQITPMPAAWDVTAAGAVAGSGGCSMTVYGTTDTNCNAVYNYLSGQAGYSAANPNAQNNALPTYASNPLWQVVDGPWKLSKFDADGNVTMLPNPTYSGPIKPTLKSFVELPYTTDSAEYNALVAGDVNVGYLPTQDITANAKSISTPGANNPRLTNYELAPLYGWAINYFPYNFNSTGDGGNAGKIFNQLYFRQAVQDLVDQPLYISRLAKGYGAPTYGPVPTTPQNSFASSYEKDNPYPYNASKAKDLLTSHGWKIVPNGTDTCEKPGTSSGECGKDIPKGAKLDFNLQYATGSNITDEIMSAEKSSWSSAGIDMNITTATFNTVIGNAVPCPKGCSWEMENWGAGWIFAPDFYPSGEEIFASGAGSNSGNYVDATNDKLIKATYQTTQNLTAYENHLAKELPVIWQPNIANPISEIQKGLEGVTPQNPLQAITPEEWHWSK